MPRIGISIECYRWDVLTPGEITYTDVVAGHLPTELRRQQERREFNYMGRPISFFSRVPPLSGRAEEMAWLLDQAVERGLDAVALPIEMLETPESRRVYEARRDRGPIAALPWLSLRWTGGDGQEIHGPAAGMVEEFDRRMAVLGEVGVATLVVRHLTAAVEHHFTQSLGSAEALRSAANLFTRLAEQAAARGIVLALENHLDFRARHLAMLIQAVNHPHLRACLNTGNSIGVVEDPLDAARILAPMAVVCMLRDFRVQPNTIEGVPQVFGTPLGRGHVPLPSILREFAEAPPEWFMIDVVPHRTCDAVQWVDMSLDYARRELQPTRAARREGS